MQRTWHFCSEARGSRIGWLGFWSPAPPPSSRHSRRRTRRPVEAGSAGGHRGFQAGAHRAAAGADGAGQAAARQAEVPNGFKIELYAAGVPNARTLRLGDKGTVFVSSRLQDKVHAIVTKDGKREVKVIASGLHRPNGIALHKGTLYIAELHQISKIEKIEDNLDNPPKPTVILGDLPKDEPHGWKYLTVGPDEKLYFQVGAPCNICLPSERHARIFRVGLDGKGLEVYAYGIRQIVGMDWHPTLKQLYFSENSRDWLSEDVPEDKLNRVTQPGKDNFGYPYCHQGNFTDPEFGWGRSCSEFTKPIALARTPFGRARLEVLHRRRTWRRLSRHHLPRAARLLEPQREDRWRRRGHQAERRRYVPVDGTLRYRLHSEQQLRWTPGGRAPHEGRIVARLR